MKPKDNRNGLTNNLTKLGRNEELGTEPKEKFLYSRPTKLGLTLKINSDEKTQLEPLTRSSPSVKGKKEIARSRARRGKTGRSGRGRVGSIGFAGQTDHGSKRVIFKRVNRVTGQSGYGSGRVDPYFSNFFFFFFNYKKTNIKLKRLRKKSNSH